MNARAQGFTLLEVLIALSLTGMLLVMIGSAINASRRSLQISERYATRLDEVRTAQDFLRSALQQAQAFPVGKTLKTPGWVFQGGPQRLSFIAPVPAALAGGLKTHTLEQVSGATQGFDLRIVFAQPEAPNEERWGQPQRLLRQLHHLRLSYRGLDDDQQPSPWLATWPWPARLPNFVRIDLDLGGPVRWPPMVVALRTSQGFEKVKP
jgi:general secretion pathway protein J